MTTDARPRIQIQLEPGGVAAPAIRTAAAAARVVGTCLKALDRADFSDPALAEPFDGYDFKSAEIPPAERREASGAWLVAKGLQDLAKGVRESLEEAYVYCAVVAGPPPSRSIEEFQEWLDQQRRAAARPNFPDLLARVNARLQQPLTFEAEFLSLQRARNCLEHRRGIVGTQDLDDNGNQLTLTFPTMRTFFEREGEKIEMRPGAIIDLGEDPERRAGEIVMQRETQSLQFLEGEHLLISAEDFVEVALACHFFATDLAAKLPQPPPAAPTP